MSRERLTSRTAEELKSRPGAQVESKGSGIDNDVYDMNDTGHFKNDPKIGEYSSGDPEAWGEGVNKDKANKDDGKREETGHAPLIDKHAASEAIASAKRLEEKAVKCIIAAQRILPGATEDLIEKQAAILMSLPNEGLDATLANQTALAQQISKQAESVADEAKAEGETEKEEKEEKECDKDKEAGKVEEKDEDEGKLEELKKMASDIMRQIEALDQNAKSNKNWPAGKKTEKKAGDEEDKKEDEKKEEKDAASEEDKKEDEKKEEKAAADAEEAKEEKKEEDKEVEASDENLLDQIFGEVTASETKKGASKLSGMVKKEASQQVDSLSSLWKTDPDVSSMF